MPPHLTGSDASSDPTLRRGAGPELRGTYRELAFIVAGVFYIWTASKTPKAYVQGFGPHALPFHREFTYRASPGTQRRSSPPSPAAKPRWAHYARPGALATVGIFRWYCLAADHTVGPGQQRARLRDRSRSVKLRILEIGRIARTRGGPNGERLQQGYEKLLSTMSRVDGHAKRFSSEIADGVKRSADEV